MSNRTLFEIGSDFLALRDLLSEIDGDVGEQEAAIDALLAEESADEGRKLDSYVYLVAEFEASAEARAAEARRLDALAKSDKGQAARLRARLKQHMERTGRQKIETPFHRLAVQRNGGVRPVVVAPEVTPDKLDERFVRVRREIDLDAVRSALESGEALLFASLGERGTSLRIK
jgi:hypothetical protein